MTIAELKRKRAQLIAEMKAIATKDEPAEGDASRFDELEAKVADHDQRIERIESVARMSADDAEPVDGDDDGEKDFTGGKVKAFSIGTPRRSKSEAKGTRAARFVIGAGLEKQNRGAGVRYVRDSLEDGEVSKALSATVSTASGGAIIPASFREELCDLLWAQTAVRNSNPQIVPMPYGNLTIPRLQSSAVASWQAENLDATKSQPVFDDIQMSAKKLTALVPVSNDLIRRSPLAVESIVRENMIKQLARAEDIAFLTSTGSSTVPTGLTSLAAAANVFTSTAAPTLSAVNNVLMALELALRGQNVPVDRAGFVMHPAVVNFLRTLTDSTGRYFFQDELSRGTLLGYPVKQTTHLASNLAGNVAVTTATGAQSATATFTVGSTTGIIPGMVVTGTGMNVGVTVLSVTDATHVVLSSANTVSAGATLTFTAGNASQILFVAWDQVLLGDTLEMSADSSSEASYIDTGVLVSSFSRDQTVFRLIEEVDLNVQHPAAIAVCSVAGWAPAGYVGSAATAFNTQPASTAPSAAGSATII